MRSYDFLVQHKDVAGRLEADKLDAALTERGATKRPDGAWTWRLAGKEVEVYLTRENGEPKALEVKAPLSDNTEHVTAVMKAVLDLATALELRAIDPQANLTLTTESESAVADEFLRVARYAGEYIGVSEAIGATTLAQAPNQELSSGGRVMLALVVFGLALYVAFRLAT